MDPKSRERVREAVENVLRDDATHGDAYAAGAILVATVPLLDQEPVMAFAQAIAKPITAKDLTPLEVSELVRAADNADRLRKKAEILLRIMWRDAPHRLQAALADLAEAVWSKDDMRTRHLRGLATFIRGGEDDAQEQGSLAEPQLHVRPEPARAVPAPPPGEARREEGGREGKEARGG